MYLSKSSLLLSDSQRGQWLHKKVEITHFKNYLKEPESGGPYLKFQHSGGKDRWVFVSSRPIWSIYQVSVQPEYLVLTWWQTAMSEGKQGWTGWRLNSELLWGSCHAVLGRGGQCHPLPSISCIYQPCPALVKFLLLSYLGYKPFKGDSAFQGEW